MTNSRIVLVSFLSLFFHMFTSTLLWSGEPGDIVRKIISKDISLKDGENTKERKLEICREIFPSFNFEEMAKRAMGKYWRERSSEEKREFVELFTKNIKDAYMRTHGPRFGEKRILSLDEEQNNNHAKVHVNLVKKTDENATADFRLIRKNGEWGVCDVTFEGVSLVNNYRSQIYSVMINSSYKDLVQIFKQRHSKEK